MNPLPIVSPAVVDHLNACHRAALRLDSLSRDVLREADSSHSVEDDTTLRHALQVIAQRSVDARHAADTMRRNILSEVVRHSAEPVDLSLIAAICQASPGAIRRNLDARGMLDHAD